MTQRRVTVSADQLVTSSRKSFQAGGDKMQEISDVNGWLGALSAARRGLMRHNPDPDFLDASP